ncbi:hypothetical protein SARC_04947 [Sphaeroforma arctica JP610]|uniref:Small EDRK-rich factor-like N-terminal domain-containing protein n=1 Tax=Sphaeroforma arctica JP610 TaxID=667725 RepID=A0A0L0G1R5_9EUKA|nr:hypothetical protein SARC_04947 [Sphaeroforma arctica JP610]KNC82771.1 hypothetical protein SARC_04947 [Sphaeroforma arctica JP610]|eukprot:XP_014156673.1 hypothetical protein SARC_04947 [Sphaeroforma arctica JP610]
MARGNERERNRAKNDAKNTQSNKKKQSEAKNGNLTPAQRQERDAKALQEKLARKKAAAEAAEAK